MKLQHFDIDYCFNFEQDIHIYSLIVDNPSLYFKVCNELINFDKLDEVSWVLAHDAQEVKLDNILCIHDFFELNLNNKKVESLIDAKILQILKEQDFLQEFSQLNNLLIKINNQALAEMDLPIKSTDEVTYENFVKLSDYKINEEIDLCNKIITYIDLFIKLKNVKVVVLVSCFNILTYEQIQQIIKQLQYMGINVLFINSVDKYNFKDVPKIIIDKDLCLI